MSCIICGTDTTRVMDGREYCSNHTPANFDPAPPLVLCAIDGCSSPAQPPIGDRPLCDYHKPRLGG